jgi:hypothetical protein
MFFKKIGWEGDPGLRSRVETLYECEKVIHKHTIDGHRVIYLDGGSFGAREIMVDANENVGLYVMNEEGRTIEIISHLAPHDEREVSHLEPQDAPVVARNESPTAEALLKAARSTGGRTGVPENPGN